MKVLGLDLGEASVGSAIVNLERDGSLSGIEHLGARVFSPITDPKSKEPLNTKRRIARGARKLRKRRVQRMAQVLLTLQRAGLLPDSPDQIAEVLGQIGTKESRDKYDPYILRRKALDSALEPFELGRVFYSLAKRRGFKSNRKARLQDILKEDPDLQLSDTETDESDADESDEETGKTLTEIITLQDRIKSLGARTLGEFLCIEHEKETTLRVKSKIRGLRTSREMYVNEFESIWAAQKKFHGEVLTPQLKSELQKTFDQRPLKAPRGKRPRITSSPEFEIQRQLERSVRNCRLYTDKPVSKADHFFAHRFRIVQTLVNLRLPISGEEDRKLTIDEVHLLAHKLQTEAKLSWAEIRKSIKAPKGAQFTIEADPKVEKGMLGNRTEQFFKNILGEAWSDSLALDEHHEKWQLELMQDIETAPDALTLYHLLQRPKTNGNLLYPLSKQQAFEIAGRGFSRRTMRFSVRAMRKITKRMLETAESTYHAETGIKADEEVVKQPVAYLPEPPYLPNPRVMRTLYEVRKVVNAIIEKHGKPDVIRIELARDIKQSQKEREKANKAQKKKQDLNNKALAFLKDQGLTDVSEEDIVKYRLWEECERRCPYTGNAISCADLLSNRTEVEHILPLPRSGDDSFRNKTITFAETNAEKGNRTPKEWLGKDSQHYRDAEKRFVKMKNRAKLNLFRTEEIDEDFTSRQLNDTRYACTAAKKYLELLGVPVTVTNGQATGLLRYQWGLNGVIPTREIKDPTKLRRGKSRLDHRHHAIDALVIALTTPKNYKSAVLLKRGMLKEAKQPAPNLRTAVKALLGVTLTSHDLDKGIRGALHDESFYGRQKTKNGPQYVRRVPVSSFAGEKDFGKALRSLDAVYDVDMRTRLKHRLQLIGNAKEAFGYDEISLEDGAGHKMTVETIRIKHDLTDRAMIPIGFGRYVKPNNNHHAEIVRTGKGKLECRTVTMIAAAHEIRTKRRSPYGLTIQDGEALILTLSENEVIQYEGQPMRVCKVSANDVILRDLNDARTGSEEGQVRLRSSEKYEKIERKLRISPLGEIVELPHSHAK